ncbi:methylated-DNA--[protein]-cysteine S-methyltransferase [Demequina sp. NBRC 110053]|uniref:methylated-DNA--[protein]-cysteine S-methyltransferase n=1 Tax=Demequina sp. NBRC 110053 TaxID=1570342 RepID=UPI000A003BF2|nr:methylated-DNA--[protein]-cysteine S-methyltransferase [Demequina sp. NBRC 110053]
MLSYETIDTPDGPFTVVERDGAVAAAAWSADPTAVATRANLLGPEPGECASALDVRAYYAGDVDALADVPLDLAGTEFRRRVWDALRAIRAGQTRTYGALADALGSPGASRAVGAACGANPIALFVPCHRVTGADGSLTGFAWGVDLKSSLLERERSARVRDTA